MRRRKFILPIQSFYAWKYLHKLTHSLCIPLYKCSCRNRRCWCSWNFHRKERDQESTHQHLIWRNYGKFINSPSLQISKNESLSSDFVFSTKVTISGVTVNTLRSHLYILCHFQSIPVHKYSWKNLQNWCIEHFYHMHWNRQSTHRYLSDDSKAYNSATSGFNSSRMQSMNVVCRYFMYLDKSFHHQWNPVYKYSCKSRWYWYSRRYHRMAWNLQNTHQYLM